jgi:serine/threonine-protein kinase
MALTAGSRVGPYEIVGVLGAGGMGEVYRARDPKLNREVALKILPVAFSGDPDRLARFRREAQVLAALNHPNIGHIYGFEDSGMTPALVLELVEGPTLADGIAQGPMPSAEAVPIARQIAEAIEAAHEQGIIHRDLKPGNVKVSHDGIVKVLDFGLAKALDVSPAVAAAGMDANVSPTMTSPVMTQIGVITGTAAYMSPEQAKGKPVDKRADIWAFGVIVWEMLTGHTLFGRDSVTETLAAVLKEDPPLDLLPADTPHAVRRLVARCLQRDPKQRLRDIGEARIALAQPSEPAATVYHAPAVRRRVWRGVMAAVALCALSGAAAWLLKPAGSLPLRRFELPAAIASSEQLALSSDGTRIAYLSAGHLYVRAFDALDAQDLGPVPVRSENLFWSPDSHTIGFAAEGTIRTVPAAGGPLFVVCKIPASGRTMGAKWLTNGTIVFSVWRDSLYSVPSDGGDPIVRVAIDPATEIDFHEISAGPGQGLLVVTHRRLADEQILELIDGNRRVMLSKDPTIGAFAYVPQGFLLFGRSVVNPGIWAVPFDGGPIDTTKATLVQPGVTDFQAANDATLLLAISATPKSALVWVDRSGTASVIAGSPIELQPPDLALSPDGGRAAFVTGSGASASVVVRDLQTGRDTRLTFNRAVETAATWSEVASPAWFPSGDRILHMAGAIEAGKLVARRADTVGEAREITAGRRGIVSSDGTLVFCLDDRGRGRLRKAPLLPDGGIGPAQHVFPGENEPDVFDVALSPGGRFLAYVVAQPNTGSNVFLTDFPGASTQWLVSEGATRPRFSRDGHAIFYLKRTVNERNQPKASIMYAPITEGRSVKTGVEATLFDDVTSGPRIAGYDVAADGRFLMSRAIAPAPGEGQRLVLVQNWLAAMKK